MAYSLFADFDGELPVFADSSSNGGVKIQEEEIWFLLATPEKQELSLQDYSYDVGGGVTATYIQRWTGYDGSTEEISVYYLPNSRYDSNNSYSYPYVVSSITFADSDYPLNDNESSEFIFFDSDSRYLTLEDLLPLDDATLRLARNEIYARLGRRFSSEDLQVYFDSKSWYYGHIAPEAFDENMLNDYERTNAYFIQAYENGDIDGALDLEGIFKDGIMQEKFLQDMDGLWECWTQGPKDDGEYAPLFTARFCPDGLIYNPDTEREFIVEIVSVSLEDGAYRICLKSETGSEYSYLSADDNQILWYFDNWEGGGEYFYGTSSMSKSQDSAVK